MRIAMIGQKGVPATYGGIERHVEELGARLATCGHEVTAFTRPNYTDPGLRMHRGMRLRSLPTIGTKHLDAIVHSLLATLACYAGRYDIVHYHAIGPCLVAPLARLRGRRVVATIHGQDWRREKWGRGAKATLRGAEWMALHVPHRTICVSESLAAWYKSGMDADVVYVPNGVTLEEGDDPSILEELGVEPGEYVLFAGRIVPEKGAHHLVEAWELADRPLPLVIAGDTSFSDEYVAAVRDSGRRGVRFPGYVYGSRLAALFRHAALFVLPSDVEGLPIVLLEALGYGVPVLASDIPPNREVMGEKGCYFPAGDVHALSKELQECLAVRAFLRERAQRLAEEALEEYDWDRVARRVERVYQGVLAR